MPRGVGDWEFETKVCSKCKMEKNLRECFSLLGKPKTPRLNLYQGWCKLCKAIADKIRRDKLKQKVTNAP